MRNDMAKVLVERERRGVRGAAILVRRNRRHFNDPRSFDDAPVFGSSSRHSQYGWGGKELNENLSPLRRFIEANVGRLWDDVYSEMRQHIRWENTVQRHILQHLWQYVERNVVLDEKGVACVRPYYGTGLRVLRKDEFYVHPVSGLLLCGSDPAYRRGGWPKKASRPKGWRDLPGGKLHEYEECRILDGEVYIKADGIWFEADMRPLPKGIDWGRPVKVTREERRWNHQLGVIDKVVVEATDNGPRDKLLGREIGWHGTVSRFDSGDPARHVRKLTMGFYGRLDRYCAGKGHQLDTKALRRLGLVNGLMNE
jgi:hypothetical protein